MFFYRLWTNFGSKTVMRNLFQNLAVPVSKMKLHARILMWRYRQVTSGIMGH